MSKRFVARMKMNKKARKALDAEKRKVWQHSPVTKIVESKKVYNRKRNARSRYEDCGSGRFDFWAMIAYCTADYKNSSIRPDKDLNGAEYSFV